MWDEGMNLLDDAIDYAIANNSFNKMNLVEKAKNVCVFGLGTYFKEAFSSKHIKDKYHVNLLSDNDPEKWGWVYEGVRCVAPSELSEYENLLVIIMMGNPLPVQEQLDEMGITWVTHVDLTVDEILGMPKELEWFKQETPKIKEAYKFLEDEDSQKIYVNAICNRIAYPISKMRWTEMCTGGEYFLQPFMPLPNQEVYVDCGAFNGDTVLRFMDAVSHYKEIHAFELDSSNYNTMKKILEGQTNLFMYRKGVWNENKTISYGCGEGNNEPRDGISIMKADGSEYADVVRLDDELEGIGVTFIKMDIEGSELAALEGAQNLIRKNHPKLAICVYHKTNDFWNIPLFLKKINPEYQIRIRHHCNINCWGTVLYAVSE